MHFLALLVGAGHLIGLARSDPFSELFVFFLQEQGCHVANLFAQVAKVIEHTLLHLALLCYQAVTNGERWSCGCLGSGERGAQLGTPVAWGGG